MIRFYVTNPFLDKHKKLITANQEIIIEEDRVENLVKKQYGYVVGKVEVKKDEKSKNLIGKK